MLLYNQVHAVNLINGEITIPNSLKPEDLFKQAFVYLKNGDARLCSNACKAALIEHPEDVNLLCLLARASIALKLFKNAQGYLNEATKLAPKSSIARETYGDLLMVQSRPTEALREYRFVQQLNSQHKQIEQKIKHANNLASHLKDQNATSIKSENSDIETQKTAFEEEISQGLEHQAAGRTDNAEDIYRSILKENPDHVEAARLLAGIAMEHEKYRDAEIFLSRVVKNAPDYSRAWADLVKAQREQDKFSVAISSAEKLIQLDPKIAESYMVKASAEGMAGQNQAAIESYEIALKLAPNKAGAFCSMAHHLKTIGKQDEAVTAYRKAINIKPDHTESYWSLANLKTFSFLDEEISAMKALISNKELSDLGRVHLFNALGLEYEGRKNYDLAFENMSSCNAVRRKSESYDPVEFETMIDSIIEIMSEEEMRLMPVQKADVTPIFIVGLPRSGSTLIEQILASHSAVEGTHELHELTLAMQTTRDRYNIKKRFPEALSFFEDEQWKMLGQEYLITSEKYRTNKLFFIDKNPNNFTFIGAIKLAIPNAKIINARRHPLDSCYGSFKQLFASGQPFSYDLVELGEYYLEYDRVMNHWHSVCPDFVLDVNYEEVVSNLDAQVKRILEFCELPFEESCLKFHETDRAVKTASSEQVRKPIYSSSVNLWRNYEHKLEDLIETLAPLLERLPKKDQPKLL